MLSFGIERSCILLLNYEPPTRLEQLCQLGRPDALRFMHVVFPAWEWTISCNFPVILLYFSCVFTVFFLCFSCVFPVFFLPFSALFCTFLHFPALSVAALTPIVSAAYFLCILFCSNTSHIFSSEIVPAVPADASLVYSESFFLPSYVIHFSACTHDTFLRPRTCYSTELFFCYFLPFSIETAHLNPFARCTTPI